VCIVDDHVEYVVADCGHVCSVLGKFGRAGVVRKAELEPSLPHADCNRGKCYCCRSCGQELLRGWHASSTFLLASSKTNAVWTRTNGPTHLLVAPRIDGARSYIDARSASKAFNTISSRMSIVRK
jgi:hypothetical protein